MSKLYKILSTIEALQARGYTKDNMTIVLSKKEQQKKDKEFIEEYNKLCKATGEFNKQFGLLAEIEKLGKEQLELLKKWEANKNLIYKKREQFYSLTT